MIIQVSVDDIKQQILHFWIAEQSVYVVEKSRRREAERGGSRVPGEMEE